MSDHFKGDMAEKRFSLPDDITNYMTNEGVHPLAVEWVTSLMAGLNRTIHKSTMAMLEDQLVVLRLRKDHHSRMRQEVLEKMITIVEESTDISIGSLIHIAELAFDPTGIQNFEAWLSAESEVET